jgi:tRNA threonylcarbamoyladenosine biosynthesis protein TsaB
MRAALLPGLLLVIDTATATAVVALGGADGAVRAEDAWRAGYRHGEELLARIDRLLAGAAASLEDLSGVVVGTGPGAFTGLRVGLATAKGIAHGLRVPLVGVPTGAALIAAAGSDATAGVATRSDDTAGVAADGAGVSTGPGPLALLLPAGPSDRVFVHVGAPVLLVAGTEPDLPPGTLVVAVDLEGRADADASVRGSRAVAGLGAALLRLGAARLAAGDVDDVALVVPEYVTLPRGVREQVGEVAWSRDRR